MGRSKCNLAAQLVGFLLHISIVINGTAVMFIEKPQNVTFRSGDPLVFFNCSANTYFHTGFDWTFKSPLDEEVKDIYNTAGDGNDFTGTKDSRYKVECPNNLTANLLIPFPNSTDVGEYCCQVDNSRGVKLCAHLTEDIGFSVDGGQTDMLKTGIRTTQHADEATSTDVTEKDGKPSGDKTVLIIVIIVGLALILVVVAVTVILCKLRSRRKSESERKNDVGLIETPAPNASPVNKEGSPLNCCNASDIEER